MYNRLRNWTLALLKVPPEPHAPIGDPSSLRVFNAGRNYFRLRIVGWAFGQTLALAGFIFWTAVLLEVEKTVGTERAREDKPVVAADGAKRRQDNWPKRAGKKIGQATVEVVKGPKTHTRVHPWNGFKQMCVELALLLPSGAFLVIWAVKILSFLVYVGQLGLTYSIRRLDYEMRWYMVTDRSLRLRSGVWRVSEATMSFANIQQVLVSQGPLQRFLGLADVKVKSAGGGSGGHYNHEGSDMHSGLFHSVTNAEEIRDLILLRLRRFREAGLGDPEEKAGVEPLHSGNRVLVSADTLAAARELAAEARALRLEMAPS